MATLRCDRCDNPLNEDGICSECKIDAEMEDQAIQGAIEAESEARAVDEAYEKWREQQDEDNSYPRGELH